jgi:hypothetical protein
MTSSGLQATRSDATHRPLSRPAVLERSRLPYIQSGSLAVVATAAALLSFVFPSLLTGSKAHLIPLSRHGSGTGEGYSLSERKNCMSKA